MQNTVQSVNKIIWCWLSVQLSKQWLFNTEAKILSTKKKKQFGDYYKKKYIEFCKHFWNISSHSLTWIIHIWVLTQCKYCYLWTIYYENSAILINHHFICYGDDVWSCGDGWFCSVGRGTVIVVEFRRLMNTQSDFKIFLCTQQETILSVNIWMVLIKSYRKIGSKYTIFFSIIVLRFLYLFQCFQTDKKGYEICVCVCRSQYEWCWKREIFTKNSENMFAHNSFWSLRTMCS